MCKIFLETRFIIKQKELLVDVKECMTTYFQKHVLKKTKTENHQTVKYIPITVFLYFL